MQCFRLMNLPDRVIAFDELPKDLLTGFEMCRADGFPRHWKEFLGKTKKVTQIPPEKDQLTGQVRRFDPIVEEDYYFYLVDWNLMPIAEKWQEVCAYVKQNATPDMKLKEKITDMAVPLAPNKSDGISLEPEEVPVITLVKKIELVSASGEKIKKEAKPEKPSILVKCDEPGCSFEAEGSYAKNSLRFHRTKKHPKETPVVNA